MCNGRAYVMTGLWPEMVRRWSGGEQDQLADRLLFSRAHKWHVQQPPGTVSRCRRSNSPHRSACTIQFYPFPRPHRPRRSHFRCRWLRWAPFRCHPFRWLSLDELPQASPFRRGRLLCPAHTLHALHTLHTLHTFASRGRKRLSQMPNDWRARDGLSSASHALPPVGGGKSQPCVRQRARPGRRSR